MARRGTSSDPTIDELLRRKKASVRDAPLPEGSPSWDDIRDERLSEVDRKARLNVPGYKTIRKLLSDRRFTSEPLNPTTLAGLLSLLRRLDAARLSYRLEQIRDDAICIQVTVPGERWEIELFETGEVEVEIFRSNGVVHDAQTSNDLFARFSD